MLTIIESPQFTKLWPDYWSENEHDEFTAFLAVNPEAGNIVPGSGGCRKLRWARSGSGKRGGVRVKSAQENIPAHVLRKIAKEMGHATR